MKVLVLLSHGSRLPEANREMTALAESLARLDDNPFEEVCCAFQQFAQPSFEKVVEDLVSRHIQHLVVMPLFLASGNHVRVDLPELIQAATNRYSQLKITITPHLGGTSGLARYILDSVRVED